MPFISTQDSTEIYYRDWGAGKPVVLIHGWPLNGDMWEKQSIFLAENGYRVINYDRRGFGRSEHPWEGYDYDTFASDLNDLMEELELEDATLVGFSMGGGEVARYLSTFGSDRVSKAVLAGAVTPYLPKGHDNPEGVDPKIFGEIETNLRQDRPAFLKTFAQQFYGRTTLKHTVSEAVLEWTLSMALTGDPRATIEAANAWALTDFRDDLRAIDIPVRVIHGTSDANVPIDASARRTIELLKNGTLSEYEGEPHGLFFTAADRLNQELAEFVGAAEVAVQHKSLVP